MTMIPNVVAKDAAWLLGLTKMKDHRLNDVLYALDNNTGAKEFVKQLHQSAQTLAAHTLQVADIPDTEHSLDILTEQVLEWGRSRGILGNNGKATPASQYEKHVEEVGELGRALIENNQEKVIDAIGDILVTIILMAELRNISAAYCLQSAYDVIAKRSGKMVDGIFVNDEDETPPEGSTQLTITQALIDNDREVLDNLKHTQEPALGKAQVTCSNVIYTSGINDESPTIHLEFSGLGVPVRFVMHDSRKARDDEWAKSSRPIQKAQREQNTIRMARMLGLEYQRYKNMSDDELFEYAEGGKYSITFEERMFGNDRVLSVTSFSRLPSN